VVSTETVGRMSDAGLTRPGRLIECATAAGEAHIRLDMAGKATALAVFGHGAGGGIDAPDLLAVRAALLATGVAVARLIQPYRVAGRRSPAPAATLDAAWLDGVRALRRRRGLAGLPLVVGGRSSGARVACRTADAAGAAGVVALAFPLVPPGRPERSRIAELLGAGRPTLVVQGTRDAFGNGDAIRAAAAAAGGQPSWLRVVDVEGADHGFAARRADGRGRAACVADAAAAVAAFVAGLVG
jgi:predicted alpha/beta-hydrolase family hydrolase